MKKVTRRERAILYALAAGYVASWREAYTLAEQRPEDDEKVVNALNSTITRWRQHPEIVKAFEEVQAMLKVRDEKLIEEERSKWEKGRGEEKRPEGIESTQAEPKKAPKYIDYSNPENQRKKLNELVNTAADSGEALDALKVIIQGQKADREAAKEQKTVRTYLPLTCDVCPLYEKAKKRLKA